MHRYFIIHKPYLVLSQFSAVDGKKTLADFFDVPKDVYPVGRLDYDSEGLLILTNDTSINHQLLNPKQKHTREYWVQVEGDVTQQAIEELKKGVTISVDGKEHVTQPCQAKIMIDTIDVAERNPPIRFRKNIKTTWMSLVLTEGKNRQVRRMTAAVSFPTLRLVRYRIEQITIDGLIPGQMKELTQQQIYQLLFN
jgi:23S rRNA pseudouridine2457 synthase